MIRRILPGLIALVLLVALPGRGAMETAPAVSAELAARAAGGPVRVIVRLDVPTVPEGALSDQSAVAAERATIAQARDAAIDALGVESLEAVTRFETIPGFAAVVDEAGLARLAAMPSVAAIEPDLLLVPSTRIDSTPSPLVDSTDLIKANALWTRGTTGSGWTVAVLDSGVEKTHTFLTGKVTAEACFSTTSVANGSTSLCPGGVARTNNPGSARPCSPSVTSCNSGTINAGIAAGRPITGTLTISGVAPGANVLAIQTYSLFGGTSILTYISDAISALEHVLLLAGPGNAGRIAAVHTSFRSEGFTSPTACDQDFSTFTQAIENLRMLGIPMIAVAGDDGSSTGIAIPACISRTVSVGATSKPTPSVPEAVTSTSNRSSLLSLLAPGQDIITSVPGNSFAFATGTSMAAAHVVGAWALFKSMGTDASVDRVLRGLQLTGETIEEFSSGLRLSRIVVDRAAGSLGPDGSPTSVLLTIGGSVVATSWNAPFNGIIPTGYRVEIALSTGQTVAAIDVGTSRSFTTSLPNGSYRLRVRSMESSGPGNASNDLPFFIGTPGNTQPPLAPQGLRTETRGQVVELNWNLPVGSSPATNYILEVGSAPGLRNLVAIDTGSSATRYVSAPVTPGTYYLSVRARNAFGTSGPSNEANVTVSGPGGCGTILPPSDLRATVVGSLVTLNWNQTVVSGTLTGFIVEVGSGPGLSNLFRFTTGPQTILAGNAAPGAYYIRVSAVTTCGQSGTSSEVVVVVP